MIEKLVIVSLYLEVMAEGPIFLLLLLETANIWLLGITTPFDCILTEY